MPVVDTTRTFTNNEQITSTKLNEIMDNSSFVSGAVVSNQGLEITTGGQLQIPNSGIKTALLNNESVTTEKLASATASSLVPSGAIMAFARTSAPTGWLQANGASFSTTTYATLFAAIGYEFGGSGGSFNVPDLRGYFVRGYGTNSDGTVSGGFGDKQVDAFKSHNHSAIQTIDNNGGFDSGAGRVRYGGTGDTTGSTGSTETRPKNIAMLYCIKT
jgi:hypothetical protein